MSVRAAILAQFHDVAREQDKPIGILDDRAALNDTGLDSLCFAIIVARLEDTLGVDPFSASDDIEFPTTVGEFVAIYELAVE